jgi:AraC family transcriptional activator of pobA
MGKDKIPVYDICSLSLGKKTPGAILAERFGSYLKRHGADLHLPHRHDFYHLVLFTKGSGNHTIDFTRFKVRPFEIYFMIPGQVHSWEFEGEADGYIINFQESFFKTFLINPNYLERFSFFDGVSDDGVCQILLNDQKQIMDLFENILSAGEKQKDVDLQRLLLLQVFLLVQEVGNMKRRKAVPESKLVLLRNFRKLIDQHFISLKLPKQYAELLYVTPNYLNALCQHMLGKAAGELIRDRVILEAKRLLTNANLNITEIAYTLNFEDNSYFNRFFKKNVGLTPEEFRHQFINKSNSHVNSSRSGK